jgi:hypothetical protein
VQGLIVLPFMFCAHLQGGEEAVAIQELERRLHGQASQLEKLHELERAGKLISLKVIYVQCMCG